MLICDLGYGWRLGDDETSFERTDNHPVDLAGYRAPEVLLGQLYSKPDESASPVRATAESSESRNQSRSADASGGSGRTTDLGLTESIGIFSVGCVFYYVLTGGGHPFGARDDREASTCKGKSRSTGWRVSDRRPSRYRILSLGWLR